ncbi:MAG TPA: energy transducer TonB, partial [Bacteroidetes bacterium]|nr:energy transducer TonB [Bacteroidota bacterium]
MLFLSPHTSVSTEHTNSANSGSVLKFNSVRKIYTTVAFTLLWILLAAQSDPFILKEDTLLTKADQMPFFTGCEMLSGSPEEKRECSDKELVHFLSRYLVYPEEARNQGIEGTVLVSFIIDETGKVVQPEVLKDIGGGCGAAAIEVVGKMPRWQPAIHQGRAVKVRMNLPIQ